jgi:hypothetical protein
MWVKILAGVGAALVVVAVGVFLAMPAGGWGDGGCGGTCEKTSVAAPSDSEEGCCGLCCGEKSTCCADETPKAEFSSGLAACMGGAVTAPQTEKPQGATRVGQNANARVISD